MTVLQRYQEAETGLLEAHELIFSSLGPDHERTIEQIKSLVDLYSAWHEAEPGQGYDAKAAQWRAKMAEVGTEGKESDE